MERCGPKMQPKSHIHILGNETMWGIQPTHSQVDSHFGSWNPSVVSNFQKVISRVKTHWIEDFLIPLKSSCLKWAHMIHLSACNTSYGRKKGWESKCQFDFWPLKVGNCLTLGVCREFLTYRWKVLDKGYNFALDFTLIKGFHKELWASKMTGVPRKMSFGCNPYG